MCTTATAEYVHRVIQSNVGLLFLNVKTKFPRSPKKPIPALYSPRSMKLGLVHIHAHSLARRKIVGNLVHGRKGVSSATNAASVVRGV